MDNTTKKSHKKLISIILLIIASIAAVEICFGVMQHQVKQSLKIDGTYLHETKDMADFSLAATTGKKFDKESLKGKWTLMFFGFTNCGMVCPTTMAALNQMYKELQTQLPDNKLPQIVMVSVDPDRDSIARMKDYVKSFNPNFIGTRADINETVALEKQLHVAAAKIEIDGKGKSQYTINHTAEILVFNPNGQVQAYLSYPHNPEQMAKDYQAILKAAT